MDMDSKRTYMQIFQYIDGKNQWDISDSKRKCQETNTTSYINNNKRKSQ